ncbi:YraN family protein [Planctopirus limnophila]|uniref:YraN family protein n=1 Tax=Planctopirus limnophila TaxID=120 RepID=UPI0001A2F978|nr:YraN family protein [Planctopirus limnophila]
MPDEHQQKRTIQNKLNQPVELNARRHTSLKLWISRWGLRLSACRWCVAFWQRSPHSPSSHRTLNIGEQGEARAEKYLKELGYQILARNLRTRLGEIDLLALEGETIVFIEVKTRKSDARGRPEEAIHPRKQKQLSRVAMALLKSKGWLHRQSRIDVITITGEPESPDCELRHYRHAFPSVL